MANIGKNRIREQSNEVSGPDSNLIRLPRNTDAGFGLVTGPRICKDLILQFRFADRSERKREREEKGNASLSLSDMLGWVCFKLTSQPADARTSLKLYY